MVYFDRKGISRIVVVAAVSSIIVIAAIVGYYVTLPTPESTLTLRIATQAGLVTLDPHNQLTAVDAQTYYCLYDNLLNLSPELEAVPGLATSWELVNETVWRLHLREGVKFHDGTPFNASAAKYNIDRLLDETRVTYTFNDQVESALVEDEYTLLIVTPGPTPALLHVLTHNRFKMVSPTAVEKWGDTEYGQHPVGTGPFMLVEWKVDQYVKFERNDDYWGDVPKLDGIVFKIIPQEDARYLALLAGEIDAMTNLPPVHAEDVENNPELSLYQSAGNRIIFITMNDKKYPLDDKKVRDAISYAIDKDAIVENILLEIGIKANLLVGPYTWSALPQDTYGPDGPYPYDPDKARGLLNDAGWVDVDNDGIMEKDGERLELTLITPSGKYLRDKQISEAIGAYLEDIGIDCKVEVWESAAWLPAWTGHEYELLLGGWGWMSYPEPYFKSLLIRPAKGEGDMPSFSTWVDPRADDLWELAQRELNDTKRLEYYHEIQELFTEHNLFVPIYLTTYVYATYDYVHDLLWRADEMLIFDNCWME